MRLLSQLAHVELTTPVPQKSLAFWTELVGLEETTRDGQSVYLRAWGDRFHHTLKLTEGAEVSLPASTRVGTRAQPAMAPRFAIERLAGISTRSSGRSSATSLRPRSAHRFPIGLSVTRRVAWARAASTT